MKEPQPSVSSYGENVWVTRRKKEATDGAPGVFRPLRPSVISLGVFLSWLRSCRQEGPRLQMWAGRRRTERHIVLDSGCNLIQYPAVSEPRCLLSPADPPKPTQAPPLLLIPSIPEQQPSCSVQFWKFTSIIQAPGFGSGEPKKHKHPTNIQQPFVVQSSWSITAGLGPVLTLPPPFRTCYLSDPPLPLPLWCRVTLMDSVSKYQTNSQRFILKADIKLISCFYVTGH